MEKYLYIANQEIAINNENTTVKQKSDYINKYKNTLIDTAAKRKWKTEGSSARFQHVSADEPLEFSASINDVCGFNESKYLYSVNVGDVSGIISKNYEDGKEQYILHSNSQVFYSIDYDKKNECILTCVAENQTCHAAVYEVANNNFTVLTSGDSIDENISLSPFDGSVLFNSRGIARSNDLEILALSNSTVFKMGRDVFSQLEEILKDEKYDFISPKMDDKGNLYYIKKPYKRTYANKGTPVVDFLLFPFRLVVNIFRGLIFLSKIGFTKNKKTRERSDGDNPSVNVGKSERELFIMGEKINLEKQEKQNTKKSKTAGFAPYNFELVKKSPNGETTVIRNGVFDYCFDKDGNIVYTNGKYVFKIAGGEDKILFKDKLITKLSLISD